MPGAASLFLRAVLIAGRVVEGGEQNSPITPVVLGGADDVSFSPSGGGAFANKVNKNK